MNEDILLEQAIFLLEQAERMLVEIYNKLNEIDT